MQNKEQLKQVLIEQYDVVLLKDTGIQREVIKEIAEKIHLPHIHVITGLRRCGKSVLLRQIMKTFYNDNGFYYLNFEDERLFNFPASEFNTLYELLLQLFGKNRVFFIDEIQNVKNFENFVRRFYDQGFKFFISGSNAELLSSEISAKLTGRHIDTYLSPFSFKEYLDFEKVRLNENDLYRTERKSEIISYFDLYLKNGGMPEYLNYKDKDILTRTYNDIVFKDIVVRYKLDNVLQLKMLYTYMVNNFGRRYSYNSLRKIIDIGSSNTVINYLSFLEQSFFIKQLTKFDYSLKKQIVNDKKSYVVDNGFINALSAVMTSDEGWLLKNWACNELLKRNESLYYFSGKNECDFMTMNNGKISNAIQVCLQLNEKNENREMKGLTESMNSFNIKNGFIISKDTEKTIQTDKGEIDVIPAWKWVLKL